MNNVVRSFVVRWCSTTVLRVAGSESETMDPRQNKTKPDKRDENRKNVFVLYWYIGGVPWKSIVELNGYYRGRIVS